MDIVLFIIALIFALDKRQTHNYTALMVLSIIGLVITVILAIFSSWLFLLDAVLYVIVLIICGCASNKS